MGLLDDLEKTALGGIKQQMAQKAEEFVSQVTDKIPGQLDDQIADDIVKSVEGNLGITPTPASAKSTTPTHPKRAKQ